ncbi:MAG: beta-ketoacyl-[acyl-carrier-protein] synthase family protein [Betaproteobacteria bacterium]|nr:MAG: beta-ketoacyl-[acyl-carrier-protein] synthase family protein [Betaproteobacteria bacterium]TMH57216.1 MAG: beta-ketoacyl-[acyl-carrier-protein] synthase family protein [Betaproteobacteria bacterium]
MASARRVAVTGLGLVNPFGGDLADFFGRMLRGESAIRLYTREDDVPRPLSVPAVRCANFDADAALGRSLSYTMDRYSQLGATAAFSAWRDAGLPETKDAPRNDWGVSWGTALGGTLTFESGYIEMLRNGRERVPPLSVVLGMSNAAASHISIQLGLGASCATYSVACASSAVAIGEALPKIRSGEATLMVVGGSEAPLSYGVVRAWEAMRILALGDAASAVRACRPFSSDRQGLVLGEGAGAMILEDWDHAVRRGARIYAEFAGCGSTSDHEHLVRPNVDGQMRAMRMAIQDGGMTPDEIDYINAHGTATREGDPIEIAAIRGVFGSRSAAVAVSATKSMHAHMLGATGVIEAIITVLSLASQEAPPTAYLDDLDRECTGVRHITGASLRGSLGAALSNSFAFGGSNTVLAFRAAH